MEGADRKTWSDRASAANEGGALATDLAHRAVRAHEVDLADAVSGPLGADRAHDLVGDAVVELFGRHVLFGAAPEAITAEDGPQVELLEREQARAQLPLRGHADAVALLAERFGHARDHPDVADAVGVAEPLRRLHVLAVVRTGDREVLQREHRVDALEDLVSRHDLVEAPLSVGVEGHELDE